MVVGVLNCEDNSDGYLTEDFRKTAPLVEIQRALLIYLAVVLIVSTLMFAVIRLNWWSALVFSLIMGQVVLNIVYLPMYIDFWSEFNSYIALYSFFQLVTPLIVFIYAITMAINDKK